MDGPRAFQVRGQPLAVALLERALGEGRLASAYLFAGPDGVGKRRLAEELASALICGTVPACGTCSSCRKLSAGSHPDRLELRVPEDRKEIPIAAVRELQGRLAYPPHEAARRVVLVLDAEALSVGAANALLKTLEEPPGRTHFVLTTSAPHALLPTVRSRCQIVRFAALGAADLEAICLAHGVTSEAASIAAAVAHGSAARALAAAGQGDIAQDRARADALDRAGSEGTLAECVAVAGEIASDKGGGLQRVISLLFVHYRDALAARVGLGPEHALTPHGRDAIDRAARALDVESLLTRLDALREAEDRLDRNASPALVAEWIGLRFRASRAPQRPEGRT